MFLFCSFCSFCSLSWHCSCFIITKQVFVCFFFKSFNRSMAIDIIDFKIGVLYKQNTTVKMRDAGNITHEFLCWLLCYFLCARRIYLYSPNSLVTLICNAPLPVMEITGGFLLSFSTLTVVAIFQ